MRKDLKKRLEKALITLQEPGGSTIRSIIKVINKDSPILSLRKVLEALQEGINEGFLCMYNGRFKLKQQLGAVKGYRDRDVFEPEEKPNEVSDKKEIKPTESSLFDGDSEYDSEEEDFVNMNTGNTMCLRKTVSRATKGSAQKTKNVFTRSKRKSNTSPKKSVSGKGGRKNKKTKKQKRTTRPKKHSKEDKLDCDSILEMTQNYAEKKSTMCRQTAEKPDVKKQRGPRCTSMKKDVRMPSKVHIPFVPPTVPQKSSTFNELLRRSPEPVNGPLYDSHPLFAPGGFGLFGAYC